MTQITLLSLNVINVPTQRGKSRSQVPRGFNEKIVALKCLKIAECRASVCEKVVKSRNMLENAFF